MNTVVAAVLLAVVATCSGTVVSNGLGYTSQYQYYYPSASSAVQYVQPSTYNYNTLGYNYVQPVVSSSNIVSQALPVNYVANSAVLPSTIYNSYGQYGLNYPLTYGYGSYGLLKK